MKKAFHALLFFLAFGVAFYAITYWNFETKGILLAKPPEVVQNLLYRLAFYSHIILGPVALMAGPFQFMPSFRNKNLQLHRTIGKIYVLACLISGLGALGAAPTTPGGLPNTIGFSLLAIAWLFTTSQAWLTIRRGEVALHREWMLRSFALTLSAVSLRLQLGIFQGLLGLSFLESYSIVAWSCWIPNLFLIEWYIRRSRPALALGK